MTRPRRSQAQQSGLASPSGSASRTRGRPAGAPSLPTFPGHGAPVEAADEPASPDRWYRYLGWPAFGTLLGLGAALLSGIPLWRCLVIALTGGIVVYLVVRSMDTDPPEWPYDIPLEPNRPFTAWEVAGLEGSREKGPSYQRYLRPRLWVLAQDLLVRRGVDPASPRAESLLGAEAYRLLSGRDPAAQPDSAAVSRLCHAIARLAVDPVPGTTPPIRNPALRGLAGSGRSAGGPPRNGP